MMGHNMSDDGCMQMMQSMGGAGGGRRNEEWRTTPSPKRS
jgi:hypothetical protein